MFTENGDVTAYFPQSRKGMLQQGEAVQGDRGFILAHARALAARKNKSGELGMGHRDHSSLLRLKIKNQGHRADKGKSGRSFACLQVPGGVLLPRREAIARLSSLLFCKRRLCCPRLGRQQNGALWTC